MRVSSSSALIVFDTSVGFTMVVNDLRKVFTLDVSFSDLWTFAGDSTELSTLRFSSHCLTNSLDDFSSASLCWKMVDSA